MNKTYENLRDTARAFRLLFTVADKKEMKQALKSRGMKINKNFKRNLEQSDFKEQSRNPQILVQKRENVSERWFWEETPQLSWYSNQLAQEGKTSNIINNEALLEACERLESQDITTRNSLQ